MPSLRAFCLTWHLACIFRSVGELLPEEGQGQENRDLEINVVAIPKTKLPNLTNPSSYSECMTRVERVFTMPSNLLTKEDPKTIIIRRESGSRLVPSAMRYQTMVGGGCLLDCRHVASAGKKPDAI